jgi:hypothetical protein
MTTSLTLLTNLHGDFELHTTGCADIRRSERRYPERTEAITGPDLLSALRAVDQDAADWFCEIAYTEASREGGCWAIANGITPSPCVTKLIVAEGITFEPVTGRPIKAGAE